MGADFTYATIPAFRPTDERIEGLLKVINGLYTEGDQCLEDCKTATREAAEGLQSLIKDETHASTIYVDGAVYALFITGGMSWGEPPTAATEPFAQLSEFYEVRRYMEECAKADLASVGPDKIRAFVCGDY